MMTKKEQHLAAHYITKTTETVPALAPIPNVNPTSTSSVSQFHCSPSLVKSRFQHCIRTQYSLSDDFVIR